MEMPLVLSRDEVRRVDELAVHTYGMSSLVLMENAGRGVVDVLLAHDRDSGRVVILCGKGNNGGDGFVIARHLAIRGVRSTVVLLGGSGELTRDALANWTVLQHCRTGPRAEPPLRGGMRAVERPGHAVGGGGVHIYEFTGEPHELSAVLDQAAGGSAWIVDAMLGTGATGEPREPISTAIGWVNAQDARRLAVDIPSGLDCDTGQAAASTVRADVTCTFVAMKPGFLEPAARAYLGEVHVLPIGVPPRLVREAAGV
jgi:NAD(P)H-hydrate epimerase